MRSFAFLNLRAAVSHVADLLSSARIYNEFPHTLEKDLFLSYAHTRYTAKEFKEFSDEEFVDYVLRLDLGRNTDFLIELAFAHLINGFIAYFFDILSVTALGSPEKIDLNIRIQTSKFDNPSAIEREVAAAIVYRLAAMTYPELRKLVLSKIKLSSGIIEKLEIIDRGVKKRNQLTHGRGIARLVSEIYETGSWRPREKATHAELNKLWRAIADVSRAVDIAMMKKFDVWRGVDVCAPGLYRKKSGITKRVKGARA